MENNEDRQILAYDLVRSIKSELSRLQQIATSIQTDVENLREMLRPPVDLK